MKKGKEMGTGRTMKAAVLIVAVVFALGFAVSPVLAGDAPKAAAAGQDYSGGAMVFDALVLRPMGLIATVFGTGVFLVSLPFTVISEDTGVVGAKMVGAPLRYTFKRPLGDF
jgi:hypothetical protein